LIAWAPRIVNLAALLLRIRDDQRDLVDDVDLIVDRLALALADLRAGASDER
jgi:hypothetical protein